MIAFASRTGNVRHIVSKLGVDSLEIVEGLKVEIPYLLITYTDGLGDIPLKVRQFLEANFKLCKGVVVTGNSNFGQAVFGGAGDKISQMYHIPLVRKIDLRGYATDYEVIQQFYETSVIQ